MIMVCRCCYDKRAKFNTLTLSNTHIFYSFQCFEDFLREVTDDDIIDEFKTTFVGEYLDIFKEFEVFLSNLLSLALVLVTCTQTP